MTIINVARNLKIALMVLRIRHISLFKSINSLGSHSFKKKMFHYELEFELCQAVLSLFSIIREYFHSECFQEIVIFLKGVKVLK